MDNVITPRALAVAQILGRARDAEQDADGQELGGPEFVFFKRLAELLRGAAADLAAVVDPPE